MRIQRRIFALLRELLMPIGFYRGVFFRSTFLGVVACLFFLIAVKAQAQALSFLPNLKTGFSKSSEALSYAQVCSTVRMQNATEFNFNAMERRLLCGDSEGGEIGTPWAVIPPNQAAYFMVGFLQSRGYHQPQFIQDGEILFVAPGPRTHLNAFRILGGPETWSPPKRRLILDQVLNPRLLDELQGWALNQIKNEGYACAEAESRVDPTTGEAFVILDPGGLRYIREVETIGDPGLNENALNRYNAFRVGDIYREYLIDLTRQRTIEDGFLQSMVFSVRCEGPDAVTIVRDVTLGPSRLARIGAGASTEEGARLRAILRQNRIGSTASSAQARANFSYLNEQVNQQVFDANYRWYYSYGEIRSFVEPSILYERREEDAYAYQTLEAKVYHGWGREFSRGHVEFRAGPSLFQSLQTRGPGSGESQFVLLDGYLQWLSHEFEYFAVSPREGSYLETSLLATTQSLGADFTAQKLSLRGQKLWSIQSYDPPLLILGTRFELTSVFSPDMIDPTRLPIQFLTFLGGEQDIRGFGRDTLPISGVGALSGATASLEARLHRVIFRRADFFSFFDIGALGDVRMELRRPLFMSPGFGLRWESPIGVFRGYAAQSLVAFEEPEHGNYGQDWRFGFTYGEEF